MSCDRGAALVIALIAVTLVMALGLSLSVLTGVESRIAGNYSLGFEAKSAADSALEFAVQEVQTLADWNAVIAGTQRSSFVDGAPDGLKLLSDGSVLRPDGVTAALGEPGWRLFGYGPMGVLAGVPASNLYILMWADAGPPGRSDIIMLRADAFGPGGTRRAVQAAVTRTSVLSWWSR
jgi:hypothetical protein